LAETGIIYIIKNDVNSKVYVGQTTLPLEKRFYGHIKPSARDRRYNYKLYKAFKTIGVQHFYPETLEENVVVDKLDEKEIYYIDKYNSYYNGYNGTRGGKGGVLIIEKEYRDIINAYESGVSTSEIAKKYSVCSATILRVLHKNGISLHDSKYKSFGKSKFIKMWYEKKLTIPQMAEYYQVDPKTIRRYATRLELPKRRYISKESLKH
jgi:hypothetical protein